MPLVTCSDCQQPVSSEAIACPACGRPMRDRSHLTPMGEVVVGGLVLIACIAWPPLWRIFVLVVGGRVCKPCEAREQPGRLHHRPCVARPDRGTRLCDASCLRDHPRCLGIRVRGLAGCRATPRHENHHIDLVLAWQPHPAIGAQLRPRKLVRPCNRADARVHIAAIGRTMRPRSLRRRCEPPNALVRWSPVRGPVTRSSSEWS